MKQHLQNKEEELTARLQDILDNKPDLENHAREATAAYLQHHQADTPSYIIQVSYSPYPFVFAKKF